MVRVRVRVRAEAWRPSLGSARPSRRWRRGRPPCLCGPNGASSSCERSWGGRRGECVARLSEQPGPRSG
eukprot:scaffold72322_cov53-Phaeocystis_antarctica.AAC.2